MTELIKPKRNYSISILILIFCIFSFTIGQFIPVYFVDVDPRLYYYFGLFILLSLSCFRLIYKYVYKPKEKHLFKALVLSGMVFCGILAFACIWTFGLLFNVWTEATVYYIKKDDPKIKIISRYVSQGAWGGGTVPSDYHVVLHRPFLYFLKIETSIDTTSLDKRVWVAPHKNFR